MDLREYFEKTEGFGILSTSGTDGRVDAALYQRPVFTEDGLMAFIMRDPLAHQNITSNPHAVYLFKENGPGYKGKRLFLTKIREEKESNLLHKIRKSSYPPKKDRRNSKILVLFKLDKDLPLVGSKGNMHF